METLRKSFSKRTIFIPITMILSLSLVFIGMRTFDLSRPQKPRVLHRAVLENPLKETKERIENYGQFFDLSHHSSLIGPQLFEVLCFFRISNLSNSCSINFSIASRAPPVFHAWNLRLVLDCNIFDIVARRGELRYFCVAQRNTRLVRVILKAYRGFSHSC